MEIRQLKQSEWTDAMSLVWKTFLKFEANEYDPLGVKNFYRFITDDMLEKMFIIGEYKVIGAFEENEIVGVLGLRDRTHISLLFVDEEYHHRGIATKLIETICEYLDRSIENQEYVTVNSSPYAVGFYHTVGFEDTESEQEKDGIRFTPMKKKFKKS